MATINIPKMDNGSNKNERKDIKPVVSAAEVSTKRKSVGRKLSDTFIKEDVVTVKNHLFFDVVVPTLKDMVINGIEMMFYGSTSNRRSSYNRGINEKTSYQKMYSSDGSRRDDRARRSSERYDVDDVILRSRGAAEDVLSGMCDILDEYKSVSIGDLYSLLGLDEKTQFTDQWWGWTDLSSASVKRITDGYLIDLPRVQNLR